MFHNFASIWSTGNISSMWFFSFKGYFYRVKKIKNSSEIYKNVRRKMKKCSRKKRFYKNLLVIFSQSTIYEILMWCRTRNKKIYIKTKIISDAKYSVRCVCWFVSQLSKITLKFISQTFDNGKRSYHMMFFLFIGDIFFWDFGKCRCTTFFSLPIVSHPMWC